MTLVPPYLSVSAVHIVVMFIFCNEISNEYETKCVVGYGLNGLWNGLNQELPSPEESASNIVW